MPPTARPPIWRRELRLPGAPPGLATAFACVSAVILGLFAEVVVGGRVFFDRDILLVWAAQVEAFVRAIASGSWPLWDPTVGFGQPLLANPTAQILYPFTWLHLVMRSETQYTLYVVAHAYLAAAGLSLLGRRLGLSRAAALAAACCFTSSGPLLSLVNVWHHFAGAAWMPWVILAAEVALVSGRAGHALLWGLAVALQLLAGSPDLCVYTHLVVLAQVLRRLGPRTPRGPARGRIVWLTLTAYALAVGLSAAQWLPTLEVVRGSARAGLSSEDRTVWSHHPAAVAQLLLPVSFEELPSHASGPEPVARLFELWNPFMRSGYLGLSALSLVAAALVGPRRPNRRFLLLIGGLGLLIALGRHTPAHDLLAHLVPPVGMLRYPSKALPLLALAWALLAGMGVDALREAASRRRRMARAGVMAAGAALAWIAALTALRGGGGGQAALPIAAGGPAWALILSDNKEPLVIAAALATAALALLAWPATDAVRSRVIALAVLAVADLVAANRSVNPSAERRLFAARPPVLELMRDPERPRVYVWDYVLQVPGRSRPRGEMLGVLMDVPLNWPRRLSSALAMTAYLYPPSGGRFGLLGSYDRDLLELYPQPLLDMTLALRAVEDTPGYRRLLQMGGVDYVVALHAEGQDGLVPVGTSPGLYRRPIRVFEVPDRLPRSYAVGCARPAARADVLRLALDPGFDPAREILLPAGEAARCDEGFRGEARIVDAKPDRVRLEADLSGPGWVVLLDSAAPGWSARVDGVERPVTRANAVFRAVAAPAGRHAIDFVYRPWSVCAGLLVSCAAALAGAAAALRLSRLRGRAAVPGPGSEAAGD